MRINAIVSAPTDPRAIEATDLLELDVGRVEIGTLVALGAAPGQEVLAHFALCLLLFLLFALAFLARVRLALRTVGFGPWYSRSLAFIWLWETQ